MRAIRRGRFVGVDTSGFEHLVDIHGDAVCGPGVRDVTVDVWRLGLVRVDFRVPEELLLLGFSGRSGETQE